MKKALALVLCVIFLTTIAATCFAAGHTHVYVYRYSVRTNLSEGHHEVAGCHNCTYRHTHTYARYRITDYYFCSCGGYITQTTPIQNGPEYCPYSH